MELRVLKVKGEIVAASNDLHDLVRGRSSCRRSMPTVPVITSTPLTALSRNVPNSPPKVERIVDGNAIEQHEILIGLATADVETGR